MLLLGLKDDLGKNIIGIKHFTIAWSLSGKLYHLLLGLNLWGYFYYYDIDDKTESGESQRVDKMFTQIFFFSLLKTSIGLSNYKILHTHVEILESGRRI